MAGFFTSTVTIIYTLIGPAMSLGYVAQAIAVARDKSGAGSISLSTWGFWSFAALVTVLYSGFVAYDWRWCLSASLSMTGCITVFIIACVKRRWHLKRNGRVEAQTGE
jgi:hypothetical protein